MVEVQYRGRLGNRLFQYCFGRIVAEGLGFALHAEPIPGFAGTAEAVRGAIHERPVVTLEHHVVDLEALLGDPRPRRIVAHGYFQRYEYYRAFRDVIRRRGCGSTMRRRRDRRRRSRDPRASRRLRTGARFGAAVLLLSGDPRADALRPACSLRRRP